MKLSQFWNKSNKKVFKCECCEKEYDKMPFCFGSDFPNHYFSIPINERKERIELKKSLCVIDEKYFFHRGRLIIPINDFKEDLIFNVWTTISEDNFSVRMDLWEDRNRINQEPYFGQLETNVPTYESTLNIKTVAIENEIGSIPKIKVIEKNHALAVDQENGITYNKAKVIINKILKEQHKSV